MTHIKFSLLLFKGVNDPDSEDPQENADETEGAEDKDNNSEYTLPTCTKSTRDCNLDTDCKKVSFFVAIS